MQTIPTVRLDDLLKVYQALHSLKSIVNEVSLTADQHARKMDAVLGEVVLNRILMSAEATFEVKA
jgi:hypothetical protein